MKKILILFFILHSLSAISQEENKNFLSHIDFGVGLKKTEFTYNYLGWWAHSPVKETKYFSSFYGISQFLFISSKYSFLNINVSENVLVAESFSSQSDPEYKLSKFLFTAQGMVSGNIFFYTEKANTETFFFGPSFSLSFCLFPDKNLSNLNKFMYGLGFQFRYKQLSIVFEKETYFRNEVNSHFWNSQKLSLSLVYCIKNVNLKKK